MNPLTDNDFEDSTIKEVRSGKKYHEILTTESARFCLETKYGITPEAGMTVRTYGKFGSLIRGVALNNVVVFYRTPVEELERHQREVKAQISKLKRWFNLNRTRLDRRVRRLPKNFQKRIQRFRENNSDFRWESEPYELFCCEQAVVIAGALGNKNRVIEFCKAGRETQLEMVPRLDRDHSGNSFSVASGLAVLHFQNPSDVIRVHGALCALVGCVIYGCVPNPETAADSNAEVKP